MYMMFEQYTVLGGISRIKRESAPGSKNGTENRKITETRRNH